MNTRRDELFTDTYDDGAPRLTWGELALLTHTKQVELFGFCGCEDDQGWYDDCPTEGNK